jgi:hypothetical protein
MSIQLSILFYSKTSKKLRNGTVPIYIRITVNGVRLELSTNRQIRPQKWSKISGNAIGNSEESQQLNQYLDTLRHKVYVYQQQITFEGKEVTIDSLREKWIGIKEKPRMLLDVFKEHNRQMKELIGKEYASSTCIRFETSLSIRFNLIS